jgi:hypothetical protein
MDKTTLLNTIHTERARFEALLAPLSEEQMCSPTLDGQWSIKDIMAHLAEWELICARWLEEFMRGETPYPSERLDMESNNRIYHNYRARSLAEVQQVFNSAHQEFLRQVNRLTEAYSEEDLNAAHRFAWTESWPGYSLIAAIADNSYEHYQNHGEQIQRWLDASHMA